MTDTRETGLTDDALRERIKVAEKAADATLTSVVRASAAFNPLLSPEVTLATDRELLALRAEVKALQDDRRQMRLILRGIHASCLLAIAGSVEPFTVRQIKEQLEQILAEPQS